MKYNLTLSSEQKKELISDIDSSLEMLRSHLMTPPSSVPEDPSARSQSAQSDTSSASETDALSLEGAQPDLSSEKQTLQSLYRMYHAYMDEKQSSNIYLFMNRFNEVMSTINEIQQNVQSASRPRQDLVEYSLQRLRVFVSDLYSVFMEFIRVLSDLLQQNDVNLSTEELASFYATTNPLVMQNMQPEQKNPDPHLMALFQAYNTQQQLGQLKGDLVGRVREVTTFLNFLKQNVIHTSNGREELIVRINCATGLIEDMLQLLMEYEKAASMLL